MKRWIWTTVCVVAMVLPGLGQAAWAQQQQGMGGPLMGLGLRGKWWDRPMLVRRLGLTPEQSMHMNEILQQHRLRLVDLRGALQKAEIELEPMVNADQPNDEQILAQVKNVAEARAQLEVANARLLLDIRHQLTPEQWQTMRQLIAERRAQMEDQRMNGMGNGMGNGMNRMGPGRGPGAGSGTGPATGVAPADGSPDGANLPPMPKNGNPPQ